MSSGWTRRVLVVEDQAALRLLVCDMLTQRGWETAGAADAAEATALFAEFDPDALLTDIDLGSRPSGGELAAMLTQLAPHLGVVFLSSYPRAAAGAKAMGVDRAVFVSKQDLGSPDDLVAALERALSTHPVPEGSAPAPADALDGLTRHQLDVLSMIARGWSNEQIATSSGATVRAVERSISRIFDRLGVTGDAAVSPRVAAATLYLAAFGPSRSSRPGGSSHSDDPNDPNTSSAS
ncbi:MAG: response regulator transcription factor [Microbacterium sp.]|uniref:response regulator n=1 Tax=Microbacterium sp. TaxID=51671 RepID=UPI001ACD36ED|nr:response regulator [Microbacterium sp.]MBN9178607.1 response regulator transcription factor [Microbacterium sp.]